MSKEVTIMANALSRDPYKNYRFRVKFDSTEVAGVNNVSAISKSTEGISYRAGKDDPTSFSTPGLTSFEPVTLSHGVTKSKQFHDWAQKLNPAGGYGGANIRKDVTIELHDDSGVISDKTKKLAYTLKECWVSEYQALPDLNAGENEIAIQTITLQHEGFTKVHSAATTATT